MARPAAFRTRRELIPQPDVGQRAAYHDLMIAAAGAVAVEVLRLYAQRDEVLSGRTVLGNRTGGRDVVRGDGIAEKRQYAHTVEILERFLWIDHFIEVRRLLDVSRLLIPLVNASGGDLHRLPVFVAVEHT